MTWKNIKKEDFVGYSRGYHAKRCAVGTTNGAGPHNVQIFVLSPDLVVLHALPGFWHAEDLARELRLAQTLHKLWKSPDYTESQKRRIFSRVQLDAVRGHSADSFARSGWQGFDVHTEMSRDQQKKRDTFFAQKMPAVPTNLQQLMRACTTLAVLPGQKVIKPINLLVHERIAARPFVRFVDFDTKEFIDYGKMHYDLNNGRDGHPGKRFPGQKRLMRKRQKEQRADRLSRRSQQPRTSRPGPGAPPGSSPARRS